MEEQGGVDVHNAEAKAVGGAPAFRHLHDIFDSELVQYLLSTSYASSLALLKAKARR